MPATLLSHRDEDAVAKADAAGLSKSVKPAAQPKGNSAKGAQTTDNEEESIKDADKAGKTKVAKEDLDILISSEANLTEEFKSKASTLFEAAVADKVIAEKKRLQEESTPNARPLTSCTQMHYAGSIRTKCILRLHISPPNIEQLT